MVEQSRKKSTLIYEELSERVLSHFYRVHRELGYGFLEKVYENALVLLMKRDGLHVRKQHPIKVHYHQEIIGEYYADIVVENKIILELKAAAQIKFPHVLQLQNYLKASSMEVGYVLNFGMKAEFKRRVFSNAHRAKNQSSFSA